MAKASSAGNPCRNSLLAKLSPEQFDSLSRSLQRFELKVPQILADPNRPIEHAYFPESGMISIISVMTNGDSIEVGTIGREGMFGAELLMETDSMPYRYFVQVDGSSLRIKAADFKDLVARDLELRATLLRYQSAFLTQSMQVAACNGLHAIHQRCCRWLLMARDRSDSDEISLTHEFLALMLGVRRASVTEVLRPLQDARLVTSNRGRITILDRAGLEKGSCECYRVMVDQLERMID